MAVLAVLLVVVAAVYASDPAGSSHVVVLTGETFSTVNLQPTFVKFFAPWCGHCVHLAPTWEQLGANLKASGSNVVIAEVDCTQHESICNDQGVRGYPTLKLFHDGEVSEYSGGRSIDALTKYVAEQTAPLEVEKKRAPREYSRQSEFEQKNGLFIGSEANFDALIAQGYSFVKFFAPWCGHCRNMAPAWQELAAAHPGASGIKIVEVDCTLHGSVCSRHGVRGYPTLVLFNDGQKVEDYNGQRTVDAFTSFLSGRHAEL